MAPHNPSAVEPLRGATPTSMRCESCAEVQTVPEGADPRATVCASCRKWLRHLDEGQRYLLVASNPSLACGWLRDPRKSRAPALCITGARRARLRPEVTFH